MGKGVKSKDNERAGVFTKELLGMTLILFSVLAFLCLVTGNTLVDVLGGGVQSFLLGCFGVYSFFVLFYACSLGFRLVSGKSFLSEDKRIYAFLINALVVVIFFILHLAIGFDNSLSVGEQISSSFERGAGGFATTTPGGALASIITAPIAKVASLPGTFVIMAIVLVLILFFLLRKKFNFSFSRGEKQGVTKSKKKQPATPAESKDSEKSLNDVRSESALPSAEKSSASTEMPKYGFFFCENEPFEYKTKKELSSGIPSRLSPFSGRFEFKRMPADGFSRGQSQKVETKSYTQSYSGHKTETSAYSAAKKEELSSVLSGNKPTGRISTDNIGGSSILSNPGGYDQKVDRPDSEYSVSRRSAYIPASDASRSTASSGIKVIDRTGESSRVETPSRTSEAVSRTVRDTDFSTARDRTQASFSSSDDMRVEEVSERTSRVVTPVSSPVGSDRTADRTDRTSDRAGFSGSSDRTIDGTDRTDRTSGRAGFNGSSDRTDRTVARSEISAVKSDYLGTRSEREEVGRAEKDEYGSTTPRVQTSPYASTPQRTSGVTSDRTAPSVVSPATKEKKTYTIPDDGSGNIEDMPVNYKYKAPPVDLLFDTNPNKAAIAKEDEKRKKNAETIVQVVKRSTGVDVKVERIVVGPSVTRYDISIPDDESPKNVFAAKSDLTFRLRANDLKMYNIPNESLIGLEMANETTTTVGLKSVLMSQKYKTLKKKGLQFVLGEDILGDPVILDLARMPHLIVSGATGMGKSVCLSSLLISLLYRYSPEEMRLIIIDPKIVEFNLYKGIPHLVFNDIIGIDKRAMAVLEWAVEEMERRYQLLADNFCKDIGEYNESIDKTKEKRMPFIVILIDEFADLIMADDKNKKKIETYIGRLAQKARASGISLILSTQRPTANYISGSIKTNIPSRICFKTSTSLDSRVVIDENGAEKLVCKGDCLYKTSDEGFLKRAQGSFISNDEIKLVLNYIKANNKCYYDNKVLEFLNNFANAEDAAAQNDDGEQAPADGFVDEVMKKALRIVIAHRTVSNSMLRTKLGIGYNRAATIIEWMARMKYVSPVIDNKSRTILIDKKGYEELYGEFKEDFT